MSDLFFYPMLRIKVFFISHGLTQLAKQWYLYITFDIIDIDAVKN